MVLNIRHIVQERTWPVLLCFHNKKPYTRENSSTFRFMFLTAWDVCKHLCQLSILKDFLSFIFAKTSKQYIALLISLLLRFVHWSRRTFFYERAWPSRFVDKVFHASRCRKQQRGELVQAYCLRCCILLDMKKHWKYRNRHIYCSFGFSLI